MLKDRSQSIRQAIIACLIEGPKTMRDMSKALGIMEKDIPGHLESIEKTLKNQNRHVICEPFRCMSCGYIFKDRKKYTRPGRCPKCRESHIENAVFHVEE